MRSEDLFLVKYQNWRWKWRKNHSGSNIDFMFLYTREVKISPHSSLLTSYFWIYLRIQKDIQENLLYSFPVVIFSLIDSTQFTEFFWIVCIPFVSMFFILLISRWRHYFLYILFTINISLIQFFCLIFYLLIFQMRLRYFVTVHAFSRNFIIA